MFLTQLEYREKPTATNWKRICFPQKVTLVSEDTQLPVHLLHIIAALPAFGRNQAQHGFADAISSCLINLGCLCLGVAAARMLNRFNAGVSNPE